MEKGEIFFFLLPGFTVYHFILFDIDEDDSKVKSKHCLSASASFFYKCDMCSTCSLLETPVHMLDEIGFTHAQFLS